MSAVVAAAIVAFAEVAAPGATLLAATRTSRPILLTAAALLVLLPVGAIAGLVVARRHRLTGPRALAAIVGGPLLTVGLAAVLFLVPLDDPRREPAPVDGMQTVSLPTGDRLAYVRIAGTGRAGTDAVPGPIVFVHGGPGVADLRGDAMAFGQLAEDGRDVVVYDQVGSGHSSRLEDPTEYTLDRDVEDLQDLILVLGLRRPILIGHSYGATVVATLVARHPDLAGAIVFSAPGAIRPRSASLGTGMVGYLDDGQRIALYRKLIEPRALVAWLLDQVNPRAAHAVFPDAEADARFTTTYGLSEPGLWCTPPARLDVPAGLGFYTNAAPRAIDDLRPALRHVEAPALIVKPECDYLPWSFGTDLANALPNARLVYLEGAGHSTYAELPGEFFAELRSFLAGQPLPIPAQDDDRPPASFRGPIP